MHRTTRLDALASGPSALPHAFLRAEGGSETVALLFPGFGYRVTAPLLHYAEQALLWRGADVLRLDLAYDADPTFPAHDPEARRARIRSDAERALEAALAAGDHRNIVLVGKSLGTLALADLVAGPLADRGPVCVWLTPLLNDAGLREAVTRQRPPSLYVIGTADPLYDAGVLEELRDACGGRSVVVDGADHGMLVPGDMAATLEGLRRVMAVMDDVLDEAGVRAPVR